MFKLIPLHSLVIAVGPDAVNRAETVKNYFWDHEIISAEEVCDSLVGFRTRPDLNPVIFAEIRHRIALKLSLGERVVVDAPNLRREDRLSLARIASESGVPVFYLLCDPGTFAPGLSRFQAAEKDLLRGDGVAEVIDWRIHTPKPVLKVKPSFHDLRHNWGGITVIGDVHGMYSSMLDAIAWARARNHYVIFLGDVIDYGPDTLDVADEVYRLIMRGGGEIILGNHERKIARWAAQMEQGRSSVRLSDGNRVTTNALTDLGPHQRKRWLGRFKGLCAHAQLSHRIMNVTFAHAGVHPGFWDKSVSPRDHESWSLFGEFESPETSSRPSPQYTWVDAIPAGETVIVGHNIRSNTPMKVTNAKGGTAIFLDTGSGKGGPLSSADLKCDENGLRVENFNRY